MFQLIQPANNYMNNEVVPTFEYSPRRKATPIGAYLIVTLCRNSLDGPGLLHWSKGLRRTIGNA